MKNKINIFIFTLLSAGILILCYPTISNWFASRNHSKSIQDYNVSVEQLTRLDIDRRLEAAEKYNQLIGNAGIEDPFREKNQQYLAFDYFSILNVSGLIGYIEIPKINVYLPIYHSTSEETLLKGVGHLESTGFPIGGKGNHSVLTAHRGLPSSRLFTDLDQINEGERFYIHVLGSVYLYETNLVATVVPEDTALLQPVPDQDLVTLVTCTPYAINSHRLLVRGTRLLLEEEIPQEEDFSLPGTSKLSVFVIYTIIGSIFVIFVLLGVNWHMKKRK